MTEKSGFEFECISSWDLQDGDVFILKYISKDGIITFSIIQKDSGYFQWVDANLDRVGTATKSNQSILIEYAKANRLSVYFGEIGYPITPKITRELIAKKVPLDCGYINYGSHEIFDSLYTALILSDNFSSDRILKFNQDYNLVYNAAQFRLLSPRDYYFLAWKVDGIWENVALKLKGRRFVEIRTARDLRKKWKHEIENLRRFGQESRLDLNSGHYSKITVQIIGYRGAAAINTSDNYNIHRSGSEFFSDLPSNCVLDVVINDTKFQLDISPERLIRWKLISSSSLDRYVT